MPAKLLGRADVGGRGGRCRSATVDRAAERLTLLSYMFFHGDIVHLVGNMLFLWVFGDNVEDAMGHAEVPRVLSAVRHRRRALPTPGCSRHRRSPLIGASGAVAGVIAAYLMLHPRVRVWVLAFRIIPLRITAGFALGLWIATQFVMVLLPQSGPVCRSPGGRISAG